MNYHPLSTHMRKHNDKLWMVHRVLNFCSCVGTTIVLLSCQAYIHLIIFFSRNHVKKCASSAVISVHIPTLC